ncbi:hypothetical protein [Bittarella massiliensis (ex Durand et al. 2017)]|uniref:ATPase n=1 Tax=Bittarella massiliensis (ex Durand et al. 2017) TaxID=1720313 RepID=A0AAW5KDN3_9FIRM|nr:hypothetical protein [Bittarella massiliensis (ex Durand et al. 2017)]MCQ4950175.1 hypothetical protein [Bittarella massiliensis (ex Durand et al. 2017)]
MEDLIHNLLEIDRGAQKKLTDAETQRNQILDSLEEQQQALSDEILATAKAEVTQLQRDSDARVQARSEELKKRYADAVQALDESYQQRKDSLVDAIVQRCVGGE